VLLKSTPAKNIPANNYFYLMIYRTDYHIHSLFSDGKADAAEYIAAAEACGLKEIGFSEHLNLFRKSQDWNMDPERISEYFNYIFRLRKSCKNIDIRIGLEVDFFPGGEKEIYEFITPLDLDYVIGSVHYLGDLSVESSNDFYAGRDIDIIYKSYFEMVHQAVESGLFDIIGHLDLVRLFNYFPSFNPEYLYSDLASAMSRHDVAFELNTNGRNRPLADFYPDRRFLHLFSEKNVPVCVNSDAHFPARVGQYFNEAYLLLGEAGYNEMAVFRKRDRYQVAADFSKI